MDETGMTLILGGVRSGKSDFARQLAGKSNRPVTFVGTAVMTDAEMRRRIERHRRERPPEWATVEAPNDADVETARLCREGRTVLWDCVTVFISNLMLEVQNGDGKTPQDFEETVLQRLASMLDLIEKGPGRVIAVSNEVGMGVVPPTPSGREFRDLAGRVNQLLAARAERVYFMLAGIAVEIKSK